MPKQHLKWAKKPVPLHKSNWHRTTNILIRFSIISVSIRPIPFHVLHPYKKCHKNTHQQYRITWILVFFFCFLISIFTFSCKQKYPKIDSREKNQGENVRHFDFLKKTRRKPRVKCEETKAWIHFQGWKSNNIKDSNKKQCFCLLRPRSRKFIRLSLKFLP